MNESAIIAHAQAIIALSQNNGNLPPPITSSPPPIILQPPPTGDGSIPIVDIPWGNNRVYIQSLPVALRFTTGDKSSTGSLAFVAGAEYNGPPSPRYAVMSYAPGDFDNPVQGPMGSYGAVSGPSNSVRIGFAVGTGSNPYGPTIPLQTTAYVNVRDAEGQGGGMFFDLSVNSL